MFGIRPSDTIGSGSMDDSAIGNACSIGKRDQGIHVPEDAVVWIATHRKFPVKHLLPKAITGLDAVLGDNCELHDLRKENKKLCPKWRKTVVELKNRLINAKG